MRLPRDVLLDGGDNAGATFGVTTPLKLGGGKKRLKFSTFYDNTRVCPHISLESMKIATKSKRR